MKSVIIFISIISILLSGCATLSGIKDDANTAFDWSKTKINQGASYIKEKTE